MKIAMTLTRFLFFFATVVAVTLAQDHDHELCACAAAEEGFAIDCSNQAAMTAAESALSANGCSTACESEVCHRNYLIVQAHHDYCLESELPSTLEDSIHLYEDICEGCDITKKVDPSLPTCPDPVCDDGSGNTAWTSLTSNSCLTDCSSDICRDNYRTLKIVHDACPDGALDTVAETNFHDMEENCNEMHGCNAPATADAPDPLVCPDTSSAAAKTVGLVLAAVALLTVA